MAEETNESIAYLKALKKPVGPVAAAAAARPANRVRKSIQRNIRIRSLPPRILPNNSKARKNGAARVTNAKEVLSFAPIIATYTLGLPSET
jgi:hypothetical protein